MMFQSPSLDGTTIAMLVGQEFEDVEFEFPLFALSEVGADIEVVPIKRGQHTRPFLEDKIVTGRFGSPCPPDVMQEGNRYTVTEFDDLSVNDVDAIFFPGGFSPDNLRILDDVLAFTREVYEADKIVAAICHSPWILLDAGIAEGHQMTCYRAIREDVKRSDAEFVDEPAVKSGNVVTGRVPDDLPQFCHLVAQTLAEHEPTPEAPSSAIQ